jgi:DNA-binding CsgD family transcriptional regulator
MNVDRFVATRDRLLAAERAHGSADDALRAVFASLHLVTEFEIGAVVFTDAQTLLPFGGMVEGLDASGCVPFWDNELLDPDFNKFNALARSSDPVAVLSDVTDGDLGRSPRFREQFAPLGAGDELRLALCTGETCWAIGFVLRPASLGPFPATDVQTIKELIPVAARVVRGAVLRRAADELGATPAVAIVGEDGAVESTTPDARKLLDELTTHGLDPSVSTPVVAAARRARSNKATSTVTLRAKGTSGRWFRLHASTLDADGRVAVVIEQAPPADLLPIMLESYGLSSREAEVVPLIARGLSTKQIAAEMCISRHTVGDYMKAIFEKCNVTSRGELVAKVFTEHLLNAHKAATAHIEDSSPH